jgi:dephospho-CoA kinase
MRVIGTAGLPGSGKGEAAEVAREKKIPVVTMGDVIRQECRDRGLDPAEDHGRVATDLRAENGPTAIAERSIPLVRAALEENETVVVDGLRSMAEVETFEAEFGTEFTILSVEAPFDVRARRLDERQRDKSAADGGESLDERDERELGFGMGEVMDEADVVIENTTSLRTFRDRIRTLLQEGIEALEPAAEGVLVRAETDTHEEQPADHTTTTDR